MSDFIPEQQGQAQPPAPMHPQGPAPTYGQPPAPATYAPAQPTAFAAPAAAPGVAVGAPRGRSWLLAALAGLVAGVIVAFLYAAISFVAEREILAFVMAVGGAVGFAVGTVSRRQSFLNGVIAVLVAVPATLLAVGLLVVFTMAGSIPEGLSRLGDVDLAAVVEQYFSDPLAYVWFGASVVVAFFWGMKVNADAS